MTVTGMCILADEDEVQTTDYLVMEDRRNNRGRNINKLTLRKDGLKTIVGFPTTLNKIDEVDETRLRSPENESDAPCDENGNVRPSVMWEDQQPEHARGSKKERPKSASSVATSAGGQCGEKRPRSSCAAFRPTPSKIPVKRRDWETSSSSSSSSSLIAVQKRRPRSAGAISTHTKRNTANVRYERCWEDIPSDDLDSLLGFEGATRDQARPTSACGMRRSSSSRHIGAEWGPRKCRSQPNILERHQHTEDSRWDKCAHVNKFKRSLKLLGLEPKDFGILDFPEGSKMTRSPKVQLAEPTFYTKVLQRSLSLDCIRDVANQVSIDDRLDVTRRRILSQAAYEEWYFKKEAEAVEKREEEKELANRNKAKLELDFRTRQEKAKIEFSRWVEAKNDRAKTGKIRETVKINKTQFRVIKSKEDAEKAFVEWKKEKDKQFVKREKEKVDAEERKKNEENQKEEKKMQAEKAFQEWKKKLDENQKKESDVKFKKEQGKKSDERKSKQCSESSKPTSFQVWKDIKDTEFKRRLQQARNVARVTTATRSAKVAERLYEAEQAFEEWLDKIDERKTIQAKTVQRVTEKRIPWAPS